jgi:hypothetical protein
MFMNTYMSENSFIENLDFSIFQNQLINSEIFWGTLIKD